MSKRKIEDEGGQKKDKLWKYVIVGYDGGRDDDEIDDDFVVRAKDLGFTPEEVDQWRDKSRMRRPTYGCCRNCWNAGPTAAECHHCKDGSVYGVVRTAERLQYLDAEQIAHRLGKTLTKATMGIEIPPMILQRYDTPMTSIHISQWIQMNKDKAESDYEKANGY